MSQKRILLADSDATTAEELRAALGPGWSIKEVRDGASALEVLKNGFYDALVVSLYLTDIGPAQLLNRVRSKYPEIVRFVVASESDRTRVVKEALGAHQLLIKPFDAQGLRSRVERALAFDRWIDSEKLRRLVARMRSLPTIPALYQEIIAALRSPDATTEEVGNLIAKDMGVTAKLLQVINSAYFGLPRTVTSPAEAVGLLGYETVKSMVMSVKLLNQYDRLKTGNLSIEQLWQHGTAVAHSARQLVVLQTGERGVAEDAFAAGLLHDVGKAVLAANFAEQYREVELQARKQQAPLWEVERDVFGANHAEVGAYLLSLWGLPTNVLEATALHHDPGHSKNKTFAALTAVHVADVLQHAANPIEGLVAPKVDMQYLEEIGMVECFPAWCEEILGPESVKNFLEPAQPKSKPSLPQAGLVSAAPPSSTLPPEAKQELCVAASEALPCKPSDSGDAGHNHQAADDNCEAAIPQEAPGSTSLSPEPLLPETELEPDFSPAASDAPGNRWLAVASVAALVLVVAYFSLARLARQHDHALPVTARTVKPATEPVAATQTSDPTSHHDDTTAPIQTNIQASSESSSPLASATDSIPVSAGSQAVAESSTAPSIPEEPAFPAMKLQGIMFSPRRPSAILNGVLVHKNERLSEVRVVDIQRSSITLEYRKQRKTLFVN